MKERYRTFTVLITQLARLIKKIKAEETNDLGLNGPHVSALYYLYKLGEMPAKDLCNICKEDKAAMSRSIDYLETNGYIECGSNLKKRYNSPLKLTNMGQEIAKHIANKIDNVLLSSSEGLSEEKRAIMYEGLETICKNLSKFCEKYDEN